MMDIKRLLWPGEKKGGGGGGGEEEFDRHKSLGKHNFSSSRDWNPDDLEIFFYSGDRLRHIEVTSYLIVVTYKTRFGWGVLTRELFHILFNVRKQTDYMDYRVQYH